MSQARVLGATRGVAAEVELTSDAIFVISRDEADEPRFLERLNRRTGEVEASRDLPLQPEDRQTTLVQLGEALVLLSGEGSELELLDPVSLEPKGTLEMDAGPKTISANGPQQELIVSQWRSNADSTAGRDTPQRATRFTPVAGGDSFSADGYVSDEWDLPICGGRDGVQVGTEVWVTVRCAFLLAHITAAGEITYLPLHRGEAWLTLADGALFVSYRDDGILSRIDTVTGETRSIQLHDDADLIMIDVRATPEEIWTLAYSRAGDADPLLFRVTPDLSRFSVTELSGMGRALVVDGDEVVLGPLDGGLLAVPVDDIAAPEDATLAIDPPASLDETAPDDPVFDELERDFALLLDPAATVVQVEPLLEDAAALEDVRRQVAETLVAGFPGVRLRVLSFVERDDTAVVTYVLEVNGNAVFDERPASLTRVDGRWQVSRSTFCDAAALLFLEGPLAE